MNNIEEKFLKIVAKILNIKKNFFKKNLTEISEWDSLRNFQLLINLEKEFKIKFNEKELVNFNSLENILSNLKKKLMKKILIL